MTRKDFVIIARALERAQDEAPTAEGKNAVRNAAHCMAEELRETNPLFDAKRFLDACGARYATDRVEPLLDRG